MTYAMQLRQRLMYEARKAKRGAFTNTRKNNLPLILSAEPADNYQRRTWPGFMIQGISGLIIPERCLLQKISSRLRVALMH